MSYHRMKGLVTFLLVALVLVAFPLHGYAADQGDADVLDNPENLPSYDDLFQEEAPVKQELQLENMVATPTVSKNRQADILNAAPLNPQDPQSEDLNQFVDDIMDSIITEDMSTYQQVKACYDYLTTTTTYGSHMAYLGTPIGNVTAGDIYQQYGEIEGQGAVVLGAHTGMCNAYASAFIVMAREIGLDAYLVRGSTQSAWGGYTYHEWAEVRIGDSVYIFDPQLEQDLTRAGLGTYNVFGKTYNEVPGRYIKAY